MPQPEYELARHAGRVAATVDQDTATWLRNLIVDPDMPQQVAGWLDGLAEGRTEKAGPEPHWFLVMASAAYPGLLTSGIGDWAVAW